MGTLSEDLTAIKNVEDTLIANKVARFSYTDTAYTNNDADGVDTYDYDNEQNIPNPTTSILKVNSTVLDKGYRAQASSITRMLVNHFFGRVSYNLNKINDNMSALIATLRTHTGTANGFATLDADGKVPATQLLKSNVAVNDSDTLFTAKGAFDYTLGSITSRSWLGKLFGHLYGRHWTQSPDFSAYTYFTYGDDIIVARSNTTLKWSSDGINWNLCTVSDTPTNIYDIKHVNDMFLLLGMYDGDYQCWWSEDGKVWTLATGFSTNLNSWALAYGLGVFVCNTGGRMYWSEDGKAWTQVQGLALNTNKIIFADNTFVSGGNGVWYSTDGKTWSVVNTTTNYAVQIRNYSDGMWHAQFINSSTVTMSLWWSTNVTTWTQCTGFPSVNEFTTVIKAKDLWLCGTYDTGTYWSADGKAWTQSSGFGSIRTYGIKYVGGLCFVETLVSSNDGLWWSVDGKAWTKCTGDSVTLTPPEHANGLFITNDDENSPYKIYISKDGKAWTSITNVSTSGNQPNIRMYVLGVWLASNSSGVWWSSIDQVEEEGIYIQ